jgi:parallel beta-helix repeat protein
MRTRFLSRVVPVAVAVACGMGITIVSALGPASPAGAADASTWWASPTGGTSGCTQASPCSLSYALSIAATEDTIDVEPGTYWGGYVLNHPINLIGIGYPVINASTAANGVGIQVTGGADSSTVSGFVIVHARYEGILVGDSPVDAGGNPVSSGQPVTDVTIENNVVSMNDTGFVSNASGGSGECAPSGGGPGDCGEGVHLVSVTNSTVAGNWISNNAGGILMTDEFGPTAHNTIARNVSMDNYEDCGITLASHVAATDTSGDPNGEGGVFDNLVWDNIVQNDGTIGQGGGILLGGGALWSAVYGNLIAGNIATGNGLAGIVIHQHAPGDLSDNVIAHNWVSSDNLDGDYDFAVPDPATTGIFVASGAAPGFPLRGISITDNLITNVAIGIFTLGAEGTQFGGNTFDNVGNDLSVN